MVKKKTISKLILVSVGVAVVILLASSDVWNFCKAQHLYLIDDIEKYEMSLNPEICESLVYRIDSLNEQCNFDIETIDCG